jgi:hypothetical protein
LTALFNLLTAVVTETISMLVAINFLRLDVDSSLLAGLLVNFTAEVEVLFEDPIFLDLDVDLRLLAGFLMTVVDELARVGFDKIGAGKLGRSRSSDDNSGAETGTARLRSVTDGIDSITLDLDLSICSAPADVDILTIAINNGSAIALDNQLIVDSFIVLFINKYF